MKKTFFFSFLLFSFCLVADYTASDTVYLNSSSSSYATLTNFYNNPPYTVTCIIEPSGSATVNIPSAGSWTTSFSRTFENYIVHTPTCVLNAGFDNAKVIFSVNYPFWNGPDSPPVDPENPDPDDPSGGGSGGSGGSELPWARENTLKNTNSTLDSILNGLSNWSSWQRVNGNNIESNLDNISDDTSNIKNYLGTINQQQVNDHQLVSDFAVQNHQDHVAEKTALDNILDYMRQDYNTYVGKLDLIKATLDTSNSRLTNVKNTLDTTNSRLTNIKGTLDTTNSHLNYIKNYTLDIKNNTSDIKDTLTDIKNTLNPPNSTIPSIDSVTTSLPSYSGVIASIKGKLLPGFSFFTPSGDEWLTLTVTIPLSSFGMNDFTFVFGGTQWATVGNGALLSLMSFCRTLSQFAFYYLLLMAIIKSLRQW